MKKTRLKKAALFLTIISVTACWAKGQDRSEEYKVYDAVIQHMFAGGITRFDMNAKIEQIVLRNQTHSEYSRGPDKENWEQVKIRLRSLSDETIAGYESARRSETELKPNFQIPFKYILISDKQLESIFPNRRDYDRIKDYWSEFYKLYSKSAGYNSLSKVGFDRTRGQALVHFVNWCGSLCGTGTYVLVEKGLSGWEVKQTGMMWIS